MHDLRQNGGYRALLLRGGRLTRFKGKVATIAPALLALAVAAPLALWAPVAKAGSCTVVGSAATCTGAPDAAADTTQTINFTNPGPATIDFDPGAGIDTSTSGGSALRVTAGADVSGLTVDEPSGPAAGLIGRGSAFYLDYNGTGDIDLTLSGTFQSGNNKNAIDFYIGPGGGVGDVNMDFTGATITGAAEGIHSKIENNGEALLETGAVTGTGTGEEGIHVRKLGTGDVVVNSSGTVTGKSAGIEVTQEGAGALLISAIDLVASGGSGKGIEAIVTTNAGTDLGVIVNGNVEAGGTGVLANNSGSGFTAVWASGSITGVGGAGNPVGADGIRVRTATGSGTDPLPVWTPPLPANVYVLTDAGASSTIEAADDGIDVIHDGVGTVLIDSETPIIAGDRGIDLQVTNADAGNATVDVTGDITSNDRAISVDYQGKGVATVDVSQATLSTSNGRGISLTTGADSTGANAWLTSNAHINTAAARGINVEHDGTGDTQITVDATSSITAGGGDGIRAVVSNAAADKLTITAQGQIVADNSGILASHNGTGDLTVNTLNITANGNSTGDFGIGAEHTGSSGDIRISTAAVNFNGTGTAEAAIGARRTSTVAATGNVVVNPAAEVQSTAHGIGVEVGSNITGDASITLNKPLTAAYTGASIEHNGTGDASIHSMATVVAGGNATGDVGLGIDHAGTGNATIVATADVQFGGTGNAEYAIDATHSGIGNVVIDVDGKVTSDTHGVSAEHTGTGTIYVRTRQKVVSDGIGIDVFAGNDVTDVTVLADAIDNTAGGSNSDGMHVVNNGTGTTSITTFGVISARKDGIFLNNGNTTTNATIVASAAVSGLENGIDATHNGTDPMSIAVDSDVTGGTGYAIKTATQAGNSTNMVISNATVSATSGKAISNNEGDSTITIQPSATIQGDISLGDGTDRLTFNGGDLSGITLFDGGDDTQVGDGWDDRLTFAGVTVTTNAGIIQNWEIFSLNANSDVHFNNGTMNVGILLVYPGNKAHFKDTGGAITGDLGNFGTVDMQDGVPDDPLTVQGDYIGDGSVLLDTQLGDSASPTDKLVVQGDNSGNVQVNIKNAGGTGAFTGLGPTDGIRVVDIQGANTGSLTLTNGPLFAGAYIYQLTPTGYLQSQPVGESMALAALQTLLPEPTESLWERVSSTWAFARAGETTTQAAGFGITPTAATPIDMVNGLWLRGNYRYGKADANLLVGGVPVPGITAKENRFWMQLGYTHGLMQDANGTLALSAYAQYKHAKVDLGWASLNPADVKGDGFGGGASLTWLGSNGLYADMLGEITFHKLRFTNNILAVSNSTRATTWRVSMETGMRIPLEQQVNFIPQAQLHVRGASFRTFTVGGATMSDNTDAVITGRLGMALEFVNMDMGDGVGLTGQITASVLHDFNRPGRISVNGTPVEARFSRTQGELRSNLSFDVQDSGVSFFLENRFRHSLTGPKMYSLKSSAGIKVRF